VERAIGPDTILLYGSAPSFPHGAIDPIRELGRLAVRYRCGLHVDCCLGGFVLPFAKKLGYSIPGRWAREVHRYSTHIIHTICTQCTEME
jgi:sphinganine-1-phosphate aldolase